MLPASHRLKLPVKWNRFPDYQIRTNFFKLIAKDTSSPEGPKVGFIITTKVGKATKRNSLKRKLSSLISEHFAALKKELEIIFIVYPKMAEARDEDIVSEVYKALSKLPVTSSSR